MKNLASAKEEKEKNNSLVGSKKYCFGSLFLGLFFFLGSVSLEAQGSLLFEEGAKRYTLENGMVVLLKENHNLPLVNLFLCVRSGSAQEGKFSGSGISHFVEHMLFKGTANRKPGEIFKEIESYGGTINAFTSYDYTGYTVTVPKEFAHCALEVLADMAMNADFNQEELEKERQVVLKEINLSRDSPQKYVSRLLWQTAYTAHNYKYPILGEEDLFKSLDRKKIVEYYQSRYVPNNMILAIVGDIAQQATLTRTKELFGDFPRKPSINYAGEPEAQQEQLREYQEEFTVGVTYLLLGFHSVTLSDTDCPALDALGVILGGGEDSRLYKLICRKRNLAYDVQSINYTPSDPGLFIISGFLKESRRSRVLSLIFKQIELIQKKAITENELESAKNKIISEILFHQQTIQAQAQDLALNEALAGDFKFTEKYIQEIRRVTPEDILRVANKYLQKDNLSIVSLIPREDRKETELPEDFTQPLKIGIENLNGAIDEPIHGGVNKHVLANKLTLLIREKRDLPLVTITVVFKGGVRAEDEMTNGLCNLTAKSLDKGTKTRNASEIASFVESKGARISTFSGNNSFGLTLNLLSKDFDQMIALLADLITNSSFPQREFKRAKENSLAELIAREDNIFETGTKVLRSTLFRKHPYRFLKIGNEDSLKKLTRRNLINFYRSFCVGGNMVLAVFGDVDTEKVITKVEEEFNDLSDRDVPLIAPEEESRLSAIQKNYKIMPKQQSLLLLGFRGTTVFDQDRYALELICQMLSQASGRLFTQIREKAGFAYTLVAYSVLGLDPGYIVIYVATTAENIKAVKEEVLRQLDLLRQKPLTEDELQQAKIALRGRKLISRQTNANCALESALDELYGLGYNHYLEYPEQINRLEVKDIKRVANKYFTLSNYAEVVIGPLALQ